MAEENAYLGLEYALEDLLLLRMQAEGQDVASREEAAQCIGETLGISCSEYLKEYGPELLPPYEELQGAIEENGRWHEEKGVLFRNEKGAAYVAGKDLLVLSGVEGTEVYYRYED